MIRIVSVKNQDGTVIRMPIYSDHEGPFKLCFEKQDGEPLQQPVHNEDIKLSVEDVCRIAKTLMSEMAISKNLEPTPCMQRFHKSLTS